jgi:hypothetical protein
VPSDVRVPLGCYLAVTLVLPALSGASSRPGFVAHAAVVLTVAALLVGFRVAAGAVLRRVREKCGVRGSSTASGVH